METAAEPAESLVARVTAGDRAAFTQLVREHQRLVERIVARLLDDPRDREEACQDVFLRVFRGLAGFRGEVPLAAWIARIAHHTAVNRLKRRRLPIAAPAGDQEPLAGIAATQPDPLAHMQSGEVRALVRQKLTELSPTERTVLTLYHLQEMPVREIALALEMPAGTVKSHLFRARRHLKERLLERYTMEELQP